MRHDQEIELKADRPASILESALAGLDAAVVLCAALLAAYLVTGAVTLGPLTVHRFSKPFLLLLLAASLRLAIPRGSWLPRWLGRLWARLRRRGAPPGSLVMAAGDVLAVLVPTLVATKLVAFLANVLLPQVSPRGVAMPFASVRFAETFAAWDSGWYWTIARNGYAHEASIQSSIAFFPLYPLLMRALAWPFGGGDRALWVAGIVISLACFAGALVVLHRLAERLCGSVEAARRTVVYVAVFPFAFFFSQVYTESLFLLLSVSAVASAMSGRWWLAGGLGGLCSLTRPNGILILVPITLLALGGRPPTRELLRRAAALALVPLGLCLFCGFCWALSGDPLAWLHAQRHWGYTLGNRPWIELMRVLDALERLGPYDYFFADPLAVPYFLHGFVALFFLALVPRVFTRFGLAMGSYVAVSLCVPLTGNALEGIGRYCATLFPVFLLLGATTSRRTAQALVISGSLGLGLLAALFVLQHKVY